MIHDPILVFTILAFVIMVTPLVAERLRVPDLVLLLLAGAVMGPNCGGLLERGEAIKLFGSVGLLYIMFIAGLEIDLHRFSHSRGRSVAFGLLTFGIPMCLGIVVGRWGLSMSWTTSVLLSCMFSSYTLLAYPIASRLGIARHEPVAVAVGAIIITDTLVLLVLTVIADHVRGIHLGLWFWFQIALGMAGLLALARWGLPWLGSRFFRNVPEKGGAQFLFVLAAMSGFAALSHYASLEPIIGAFLAGVAFNRLIPEQSALMNRVQFVGNTLFIPFFLISIGMLVDLGSFAESSRNWVVAACMVFPMVAAKWTAAQVAGKLFGYNSDDVKVMFGLSVVHAAAILAVVLVGYELKIFDDAVLNGAIAIILVSCPLGAWMVDRYGRRVAARSLGQTARPRGEQRLLVPVANPESANKLLELAFLLRDSSVPGAIQPVTIITEGADTAAAVAEGEKLLARCLSQAAAVDMPLSPGVRVGLNIGDGIIRAAKELRSDSVLLGWRDERSAASRVFGTVLDNLLDECPARIVLCRLPQPLNTTRRLFLVLPPMAERRNDIAVLVRNARWLAKQVGASLRVLLSDPAAASKLRALIDSSRPSVPTSYHESAGWGELRTQLLADIRPDDMAILPVERRHGAMWSPNLNRLPESLAERFPDMNLLAVYPGMASAEDEAVAVQDDVRPDAPDLVAMDGRDGDDLESALGRMARSLAAWTHAQRAEVLSLLEGSASGYPMELAPGVVFLHAHSDVVDKPTLLVWNGGPGLAFHGCATPARTILALISPSGRPPELHLKALADLARRFHDPKVAEAVRSANSAAAVCRAMKV